MIGARYFFCGKSTYRIVNGMTFDSNVVEFLAGSGWVQNYQISQQPKDLADLSGKISSDTSKVTAENTFEERGADLASYEYTTNASAEVNRIRNKVGMPLNYRTSIDLRSKQNNVEQYAREVLERLKKGDF